MPDQATINDSLIGLDFGHYRALERVGSGGMGVVYRAYDAHLEREVAIKVLNPGTIADDVARKRFRNEARVLSKLNHPNIATVHDFDSRDECDFLVMEYIRGVTLSEKLRQGSLPEKEVLALGIQLAEGLCAAHEHAVVHRDLKPGNLRLTTDGRLKILDFGLAKLRASSASIATESTLESRAITGTLAYMAPEQLYGEEIDARADIYAAGLVLYEMATGQRPFAEVERSQLIGAILRSSPRPAGSLNPRLSPELSRIIGKCLEKEPENRYQSAKELMIDLRRLQTGVLSAVQPTAAAARWPFAKPVGLGLLILGFVVTLLVALNVGNVRQRLLGHGEIPRIESLAVLPFTTNAAEGISEYLADGITEGVIDDLSQVSTLRIMARSTVFHFKGKEMEPQQVGTALKVQAVVTGHIAQHGDDLTVQTELVNVADGAQLWGQQFTRKMEDVSSLQGDVAGDIASRLRLQLSGKEKERISTPGTRNRLAYQLYLKGRFLLAQRRGSGMAQAIESFQQAVALDPTYAQAYASLAITLNVAPAYLPPVEVRMRLAGKAEAEKALALNPTLSEAHTALGLVSVSEFDWSNAEREYKLAIENNPNDAEAHYFYALNCLIPQKRFDEAISQFRRALDLDPLSGIINANFATGLIIARRFDEAHEQLRKTLELDPSFGFALARASDFEAYLGNYASARELLIRAYPEAVTVDFGTGKEGFLRGRLKHAGPLIFPNCYAMLGRTDEAFQALTRNVEYYPIDVAFWIRRPELDSLHSDPRYAELLHRMNLSP